MEYILCRILFSHEKEEILPLGMTRMDPEGTAVSEISQTKKTQILHSNHLHAESKKRSNLDKKSKKVVSQGK